MTAGAGTAGTGIAGAQRYAAYGRCLESVLPLPELEPVDGVAPRWHFAPVDTLPAMQSQALLGAEEIYQGVHARLHAHADGHRVTVDDTGDFDLSHDGSEIRWARREPAWPDFVRAHLVGRVLATTMYLDGWLPLHASAVETSAGVIGFLAPKGFGKSTLALALVHAGARLVTDDTLPVEPGAVPRAWPGVHAVRVHREAMEALGLDIPEAQGTEGKHLLNDLAPERRLQEARPLAALYLIAPVDPADAEVRRTALVPQLAAIGLVAHVKAGSMLGSAAAPQMLARAATIASGAPVFQLQTPRDLALLPTVAATLLSWHGGAPA